MPVAVKVLPKQLCEQREDYAPRFLREARTAARLMHPNIVRVIDCGVAKGHYYMVMDYVDGENGLQLMERHPRGLDWGRACEIVMQVAEGLEYAAARNVVHRDVKPANIMLDRDGRVLITDLGLAKLAMKSAAELTAELRTVGTPNYMSPEQIRNPAATDHRADIYSLGATLYRFVCGRPPFVGASPMDVVAKHLTEPLVPASERVPDVPAGLSAIISRMMAKSVADRYQDYRSFLDDMQDLLAGREVSAVGFRDTPIIHDDAELARALDELDFLRHLEIDLRDEPKAERATGASESSSSVSVELFDTPLPTDPLGLGSLSAGDAADGGDPGFEEDASSFALPARLSRGRYAKARFVAFCKRYRWILLPAVLAALATVLLIWAPWRAGSTGEAAGRSPKPGVRGTCLIAAQPGAARH
jgi:serine/threonine protein kinase